MKNNIIYIFEKYRRTNKMQEILHKIKELTPEDLLNQNNIDLTPPVQIETLLEKIGISVIEQNFTDIEIESGFDKGDILGAAISSGEDLAIFYKKGDANDGIRFTLAHELAHCCLDYSFDEISHLELRIEKQDENEKENKANEFASKILIPEKSLKETYNKFLIPSLSILASIFEVPVHVMEERLKYLKLPYYKDNNV